jgi:broad specificity phosphatase PhoE
MVTVLAIRHADIDLPAATEDPGLSAAGRARADALAYVVGHCPISTIFTSRLTRTKQTVEPTARLLGLLPRVAPTAATLARQARAGQLGSLVLVAGHTNTIPPVLTALGATSVPVIGEREFDNLFVLTTHPGGAELLQLRYGSTSSPSSEQ